jgi:AraC family ethanolamine operon transcriptional activator
VNSKVQISLQDLHFDSATEQGDAHSWVSMRYKQLSSGAYHGRIRVINFENFKLVAETQNQTIQKLGVFSDQYCGLAYAHNQTPTDIRADEYQPSGEDVMFLFAGGKPFDVQVEANTDIVYFLFEHSYLMQWARVMNPSTWQQVALISEPFVSSERKSIETYVNLLLEYMGQEGLNDEQAIEAIGNELLDLILVSIATAFPRDLDQTADLNARRLDSSLVSEAIQFIDTMHASERSPGVKDLCEHLTVSEDTLLKSFTAHLGLSTKAYLRINRLNGARTHLLKSNGTDDLKNIAARWHFLDMSEFSEEYQQMFGELPIETLGRGIDVNN